MYEKIAEKNVTVDAPSVDSYKEMLEIIQEQIEKESGIKVDERIADGYYFAKSLKLFEYIINNPKMLEEDCNKKIEVKENH